MSKYGQKLSSWKSTLAGWLCQEGGLRQLPHWVALATSNVGLGFWCLCSEFLRRSGLGEGGQAGFPSVCTDEQGFQPNNHESRSMSQCGCGSRFSVITVSNLWDVIIHSVLLLQGSHVPD